MTPAETYETNVMGTVNLLDAIRRCPSVRAVVVVTSDKCYENTESSSGYGNRQVGRIRSYSAAKLARSL